MVTIFIMMAGIAVIGGYVAASALLFKYPTLIHKRKKLKFRCKHISHRGGRVPYQKYELHIFNTNVERR